jgi:hypothetical protein
MRQKQGSAWRYFALALGTAALTIGCGNFPSLNHRTVSKALPSKTIRLGKGVAPLVKTHPELLKFIHWQARETRMRWL